MADQELDVVLGCYLNKGTSAGDGGADGFFAEDCFDPALGQLNTYRHVGVVWCADDASVWLGNVV